MTLSYARKINGSITNFVEKIIASLHYENKLGSELNEFLKNFDVLGYKTKQDFINKISSYEKKSKKHTIRLDDKNKWKLGNKIHSKVWSDKPYNSKTIAFAPIINVRLIQEIEISYPTEFMNDCIIKVDGRKLTSEEMQLLAWNDGFSNLLSFYLYFKEDFKGKIIHWTNTKY
jgi:hypothetical protein